MRIFFILISVLTFNTLFSQGGKPIPMVGGEHDSIPAYLLEEANIVFFDAEYQKRYDNAKFYALRVYEYAMLASSMLNEFEDSLANISSKRDQKKYLKEVNNYIKDEFGDEVSNMTINRGMYLMKIIHKETGLTAYNIIQNYNGGMNAFWWQSVVKLFGTSLKHEYEPLGEDDALARVLREIETGQLTPVPRPAKTQKAKDSMSKKEKKKIEKEEKKAKKKADKNT